MKKQQLSAEQKRLETDLWIIALVTLGVFLFYAATGKQLMSFVANSNISVIPRLLLNAGVQFGVAGLGITIVCILRKESFTHFGLIRKKYFQSNHRDDYMLCPVHLLYFFIRSIQWLPIFQYFNHR